MTQEDDLNRFLEHFPIEADLTLQILKGHLLVEEAVREAFDISLENKAALRSKSGANFSCHQMICLLEASVPAKGGVPWIWKACKMLNRIRNDLAHKLDTPDLERKVQEFVRYCLNSDANIQLEGRKAKFPEDSEFVLVIASMAACLASLKEVLVRRKSYLA